LIVVDSDTETEKIVGLTNAISANGGIYTVMAIPNAGFDPKNLYALTKGGLRDSTRARAAAVQTPFRRHYLGKSLLCLSYIHDGVNAHLLTSGASDVH